MTGALDHTPLGSVAGCRRYPVKSLQGLEVDHLEVDPTGVDGDRTHGIVDVGTGHLLTAKLERRLLTASADDQTITLDDGTRVDLTDPATDQVLSTWLERKVRLVTASSVDQISYQMTFDPPDDEADYFEIPAPPNSLLDLAPLHVVTTATLAGCAAARPDLDWDTRRFRPNLVLDVDVEPFGEQAWVGHEIEAGSALLRVTSPTVRCAMPLRAQPGLDRQPELFSALNELNTLCPNHLGLYAEVVEAGRIDVGDAVTLR